LVDVDKIAKLDVEIVTCNLIDLYAAFFDIVGAQTDEDGVPPLLPRGRVEDSPVQVLVKGA
jgi:hypothetical protein